MLLDLGAGNQPFKVWYSGLAQRAALAQLVMLLVKRLGKFGSLVDNRLLRLFSPHHRTWFAPG